MIYSEALEKNLFIKVTQRALRTINKAGGLDNYLLDDRPCRVREMGIFGWHLRWQIMQTPKIQAEFKKQRKELGISQPPTFEEWMKQNKPDFKEEVEKGTNIKALTRPTYNWKVH